MKVKPRIKLKEDKPKEAEAAEVVEEAVGNPEEQKKLFALLRQLSQVQKENRKLSFAIHARDARDTVTKKVQEVGSGIAKISKSFGKKAQKLADDYLAGKKGATAIKEYQNAINALVEEYEAGLKGIQEEKAAIEVQETEAVLELNQKKAEREKAKAERDAAVRDKKALETQRDSLIREIKDVQSGKKVQEEIKPLRTKITELSQQIQAAKLERKQAIDNDDEKAVSKGKRKIRRLNRQLTKYTRKLELQSEKAGKEKDARLAEMYAQLKKINAEIREAEEEVNRKRAKLETCRQQIDIVRRKLGKIKESKAACASKESEYVEKNQEFLKGIKTLAEERDREQSLLPKQNAWQKMLGFVVNKFNGAAKFTSIVVGGVVRETGRLVTEGLPTVGRGIVRVTTSTIDSICETYQGIKEDMIDRAETKLEQRLQKNQELKERRAVQKSPKAQPESEVVPESEPAPGVDRED